MCSVGGAGRAKLECSVQEEDWQTGQSYVAHWHSFDRVTPQHYRLTVMEAHHSEKHLEARRLLQRFLSGAISKNNTKPKTYSTRRPLQPTSDLPAMMGSKVTQGPVRVQGEVCCGTLKPGSIELETSGRKTVLKTTKLARFLG